MASLTGPGPMAFKKRTKTGPADCYRIVLDRDDIKKAFRILSELGKEHEKKKALPLFTKIVPFHDYLSVHSTRTDFRRIAEANLKDMRPFVLRMLSTPSRRRRNRMMANHPILGV